MKTNCYVDIHALQTLPPSCVNRDDTGSPKTAVYGGVPRSRVSSQSWKHAIREDFNSIFREEDLGKRTKFVVEMVSDKIQKIDPEMDPAKAYKLAENAIKNAGISTETKNSETKAKALTFLSQKQAESLAHLILEDEKDKKKYKAVLAVDPSIDMALFGRMVASDPTLNWDASCQLAHAISTHKCATEYDYFTAVDDLGPEDNAGAGHIGVSEFNSATLYRFATINVNELAESLGDQTPEVVEGFIQAFIHSMPTGKQNSFANRTLPSLIYVTVREDQPVSLAGAFEKAIPASEEGYEERSAQALENYASKLYENFVDQPKAAFYISLTDRDNLGERVSQSELTTQLKELLRQSKAEV